MFRAHHNLRPVRRTAALVTSLALALLLGLGAAIPVAAADSPADGSRASWGAALGALNQRLGRLFGLAGSTAASDSTGPEMDPDGHQNEGDAGPEMDPDGHQNEGDAGPEMDPDG